MPPCQVCFDAANKRCSKCKIAHYCSPQHSAEDWQRHKRECKTLAEGLDKQVGYPHKVKAVLFPVGGGEARIVEVPYRLEHTKHTPFIPAHRPDFSPFLGRATTWFVTIQTDGFKSGSTPLGRSLTLVHNDHFIAEECPLNECVRELTNGQGYRWADNVIGMRNTRPADRVAQFEDVTEDDVRVMKKYFVEGGDGHDALDPITRRAMEDALGETQNIELPGGLTLSVGRGPRR